MAVAGKDRRVYLVNTDTNTVVKGEQNYSLTINNALIDTSDKDNDWDTKIAGSKSWSLSVTANADTTDASQTAFLDSVMEGDEIEVLIGTTTNGFKGEGFVESAGESAERGGVVSRDFSIQGNGALSKVTE
jgi:predicted secreted protein